MWNTRREIIGVERDSAYFRSFQNEQEPNRETQARYKLVSIACNNLQHERLAQMFLT